MITKHSLDPRDAITMAKLRPMLASTKGSVTGPSARAPFDELMEQMPPARRCDLRKNGGRRAKAWKRARSQTRS